MSVDDFDNLNSYYRTMSEDQYVDVVRRLFCLWNSRLLISAYAHYLEANRCEKWEKRLSIFNISAAILVLFLSSNDALRSAAMSYIQNPSEQLQLADSTKAVSLKIDAVMVSILSFFVVLSSAAQYILQYAYHSGVHKNAGNEFSNLRRKVERYWSRGNFHPEAIHSLNRSYNMLSKAPPLVTPKLWKNAKDVKKDEIAELERNFFQCAPGNAEEKAFK